MTKRYQLIAWIRYKKHGINKPLKRIQRRYSTFEPVINKFKQLSTQKNTISVTVIDSFDGTEKMKYQKK